MRAIRGGAVSAGPGLESDVPPVEVRDVGVPWSGQPVPWNEDAERAVLGACLADADAVRAVRALVEPEDFYREGHRHIYAALAAVHDGGAIADPVAVLARLDADGTLAAAGGRDYLLWLESAAFTSVNVTYHAKLVRNTAAQRRLATTLGDLARRALESGADAASVASAAVQALVPQASGGGGSGPIGFVAVQHLLYSAMETIERRSMGDVTDIVSLGLPELDGDPVGGAEAGDLVTLILVSSHGKTALQTSMMRWAAESGTRCAFVSAEMAAQQLVNRMLSGYTGIPYGRLRRGNIYQTEWPHLNEAVGLLGKLPVHIDDTPVPFVEDVGLRIRALKVAHPDLQLVFVDYAQLLRVHAKGRSEEIRAMQLEGIANGLKALAKELRIVIVVSAQPDGKSVDRRDADSRMPEIADIAWGQAFRNASDLIVCGYRPGKYDPSRDDNVMMLGVRKGRACGNFDFWLRWNGPAMLAWSPQQRAPWLRAA